jgi:phosphoribosyl isomerase A
MNLIPVIDLMHGQVVRAQRGQRASYRPIVSTLCPDAAPTAVARALVTHCAAQQLYVADLDALQGRGAQVSALRAILQALPGIELWLDAGFADAASAAALHAQLAADAARVVSVFGSESLRSRQAFEHCIASSPEAVLSLDRRDGRHLDAAGCWELPALWPSRVIVMTLERVGADAGPDLATLRSVQSRAPGASLIGAGGIRDGADLERARAAGAAAWLVASALHDGRLPAVRHA